MEYSQDAAKSTLINYKIILLIAVLVILFHFLNPYALFIDYEEFTIFDVLFDGAYLACAVFSFYVAKRYFRINELGKAYLSLGLGFVMVVVGDVSWFIISNILKQDPFPSITDVFYFSYYPFALYHIIKNVKFFKHEIKIKSKIYLILIPVTITGIFIGTTMYDMTSQIDFLVSIVYVAAASTTLAFSFLGLQIFKKTILKNVWLLLVIGILFGTIGDLWYYLGIINSVFSRSPTYAIYAANSLLILYALYKHRKTL